MADTLDMAHVEDCIKSIRRGDTRGYFFEGFSIISEDYWHELEGYKGYSKDEILQQQNQVIKDLVAKLDQIKRVLGIPQ